MGRSPWRGGGPPEVAVTREERPTTLVQSSAMRRSRIRSVRRGATPEAGSPAPFSFAGPPLKPALPSGTPLP